MALVSTIEISRELFAPGLKATRPADKLLEAIPKEPAMVLVVSRSAIPAESAIANAPDGHSSEERLSPRGMRR